MPQQNDDDPTLSGDENCPPVEDGDEQCREKPRCQDVPLKKDGTPRNTTIPPRKSTRPNKTPEQNAHYYKREPKVIGKRKPKPPPNPNPYQKKLPHDYTPGVIRRHNSTGRYANKLMVTIPRTYKRRYRKVNLNEEYRKWRVMTNRDLMKIPRDYSTDKAKKVQALIMQGETLHSIAKNPTNKEWGCPSKETLYKWYQRVPEFREYVDTATQRKADLTAESLYEIMDKVQKGKLDLPTAKFMVDQYKWIAERLTLRYKTEKASTQNVTLSAGNGKLDFKIILAPETQPKLMAPAEDTTYEEVTEEDSDEPLSDTGDGGNDGMWEELEEPEKE